MILINIFVLTIITFYFVKKMFFSNRVEKTILLSTIVAMFLSMDLAISFVYNNILINKEALLSLGMYGQAIIEDFIKLGHGLLIFFLLKRVQPIFLRFKMKRENSVKQSIFLSFVVSGFLFAMIENSHYIYHNEIDFITWVKRILFQVHLFFPVILYYLLFKYKMSVVKGVAIAFIVSTLFHAVSNTLIYSDVYKIILLFFTTYIYYHIYELFNLKFSRTLYLHKRYI